MLIKVKHCVLLKAKEPYDYSQSGGVQRLVQSFLLFELEKQKKNSQGMEQGINRRTRTSLFTHPLKLHKLTGIFGKIATV